MNTLCAVWLAATVSVAQISGQQVESPVGRTIQDFQLQDYLGTEHRLADWSDQKAVVVIFLGAECPLARLYGTRLAELDANFGPRGVAFVGINSNQQDSLAEIAHYARTHHINFTILKDPGNRVADQFGAQRTPEVFLLDSQRVVRYWGRIDDQYGVGYTRAEAKRNDLAEALAQLLTGRPVEVAVTRPVGCLIGRLIRKPGTGDVTYSNQISRVLQKHCVSCHRPGQIAPFALGSYSEVVGWAETICEVIEDGRMPPWHANPKYGTFANDARLTQQEKQWVYDWVRNGVPEGNPSELPQPAGYSDEWQIPQPDVVYRMPETFRVPAKGAVPYKYFYLDPGFTEDKWIVAAEGRPGNRSVVHHLILFFIPPGKEKHDPGDPLFNSVAGFAPGMPASIYPAGTARRIPAGSKLAFQLHYTPNGSPQEDVSEAGLVFTDPKNVRQEISVAAALNFQFRIPAGANDYQVNASYRFDRDMLLYSLLPHMHLRGKSFSFAAEYPDGGSEILLDVPRYDFNWQNVYLLAQPKRMPEGTLLKCTAHFDNSEENLVNPDPTKAVYWGDQTWQEMMVGTFAVSPVEQD